MDSIEDVQDRVNRALLLLGAGKDLIGNRSSGDDYEGLFDKIEAMNESASGELKYICDWVNKLECGKVGA